MLLQTQDEFKGYVNEEENLGEEEKKDEEEGDLQTKKSKIYYDKEDIELKDLVTEDDKENKFNTIFIPQAISDNKLVFFRKIPKLGCY